MRASSCVLTEVLCLLYSSKSSSPSDEPLEIKLVSPTIGKGVFAKRSFAEGEVVFSELPMLSAQLLLSKVRPALFTHVLLLFASVIIANSCGLCVAIRSSV